MNQPQINVTPLIDVLLVLLIIFMVVAPLKPDSFKPKIPAEPKDPNIVDLSPEMLVVVVGKDASLALNNQGSLGNADDPQLLIARLRNVFEQRIANGALSQTSGQDPNRAYADRIERTVFIKAPRRLDYGRVARVVDAVKLAGAYPIGLQIDYLE